MFSGSAESATLNSEITKDAFLVDVRTPGEFASGSVKGAVNIPLSSIEHQLGRFKGKKNIVVFCRSGNRSGQAKRILERNGIEKVINGGTRQHVELVLQ